MHDRLGGDMVGNPIDDLLAAFSVFIFGAVFFLGVRLGAYLWDTIAKSREAERNSRKQFFLEDDE